MKRTDNLILDIMRHLEVTPEKIDTQIRNYEAYLKDNIRPSELSNNDLIFGLTYEQRILDLFRTLRSYYNNA